MHPLSFIFLLICSSALGTVERAYQYTPSSTSLEGTLESRVYPGPPNYENLRNGDAQENVWLLRLPRTIELRDDGDPKSNDEGEKNVRELQLILSEGMSQRALDSAVGRRVRMRGKFSHALFGHHHTRVLFEVKQWSLSK